MEQRIVKATGFSLPPYWFKDHVMVVNHNADTGKIEVGGDYTGLRAQNRLIFRKSETEDFVFPIDPFIGLSFRNTIARRYVSKGKTRGTIKERWTEDDVEITISGVFISENENEYPAEVATLIEYFEAHEAIEVSCDLMNNKGITRIVIESLDLPHTKGMEAQAYEIKALSDDVFEFLQYNE